MARSSLEHRFEPWIELTGELFRRHVRSMPVPVLSTALEQTFGVPVLWNWMDGDASFGFRLQPAMSGWLDSDRTEFWAATGSALIRSCDGS